MRAFAEKSAQVHNPPLDRILLSGVQDGDPNPTS